MGGPRGSGGSSGGGSRPGSQPCEEVDGVVPRGRTDKLVNARRGSSPQAQSTGALGSPGRRETAGQHRWVQHLSENTNKVEMVKAMAHRAGEGQTKYGRKKTRRQTRLAEGVSSPSKPLSRAGGFGWPHPQGLGVVNSGGPCISHDHGNTRKGGEAS
uniref:Uncharacterized protein n=1 Tax=Piliocolobus tephrosceles TaxID=591936 RepID=A0A8C9HHG0_9PRIM